MNSIHDIHSQTPEAYARVIADQYLHDLVDWQKMGAFIKANDSDFVIRKIEDICNIAGIDIDLWYADRDSDNCWFAGLMAAALNFSTTYKIKGYASNVARGLFLEIIEHVAMQEAQERFDRP